jgi:hypothetical protein
MLVVRTTEDPADPLGQLMSAEQPLGLDHFAFGVIHLGSIALSHGLFVGSRQGTIRTPVWPPLSLTLRLWASIQSRT